MKLYAFHCGGDMAPKAIFDPLDSDPGEMVYDPWFFYLIQHGRQNILFDTGVHPDLISDPALRLGQWADAFEMRMQSGDDVISQLRSVGVEAPEVGMVVLSHMHFDHVSGLELFRHARIVVQRSELSFARAPAVYQRSLYLPSDFAGDFDWDPIDGVHDLCGDGRLEIFPTPGHSPGHQSLMCRLDGDPVLLMGDATYLLPKMRERLLPAICWSPDAMVASWELIEWLERRERARLLCSHDQDFRERVKLAPGDWYE